MKKTVHISSPGRICLFGDHQDYLGLPVIACAIDRFVFLSSELNSTDHFHIKMPDIGEERTISFTEAFDTLQPEDHLASTLKVVRRYGCLPDRGYTIVIKSTIPINAGVSSSSAIVVAWTHFLLEAFGCDPPVSPQLIAQIAYEAEVLEHNSPGGKMDQFTISLGSIVYLETGIPFSYETIGSKLQGLVLAESGVPKETLGLLSELRGKALKAIRQVKANHPHFNLRKATVAEVPKLTDDIDPALWPFFYAAVQNHSITRKALGEFRKEKPDLSTLGKLMSAHHDVLKDTLQITVPLIDGMIDMALAAGAYGAKIVGSGGGGSIVVLAPPAKTEAIVEAIKNSGARDAYEVEVAGGTHASNSTNQLAT